ncbi:hypothetical protein N9R79_07800 [Vibrio sp.]|nr:hypothetical protein [Vibrio sp.]
MTNTNKKNPIVLALATGLALSAGAAKADLSAPSNYCESPIKPQEFSSEYEVENFRSELYDYRRCVQRFVHSQQEAILNHQQARNEALETLNNYEQSIQR